MDTGSYLSDVFAGFEFLMALASLVGIFGAVLGGYMLFFGSRPFKTKGLKLLLVCVVLLALFGLTSGIKYFRF